MKFLTSFLIAVSLFGQAGTAPVAITNNDKLLSVFVPKLNTNFTNLYTYPRQGVLLPALCTTGEGFLLTSAAPYIPYYCTATNTWTSLGLGAGLSWDGTTLNMNGSGWSVDSTFGLVYQPALSFSSPAGTLRIFPRSDSPSPQSSLNLYASTDRTGTNGVRARILISSTSFAALLSRNGTGWEIPPAYNLGSDSSDVNDVLASINFLFKNVTKASVVPSGLQLPGAAQPTCSVTVRGVFWVSGPGHTAGVKDSASVCMADAANTYAWRTIY